MSRTLSPEQQQARYNFLTPAEVADQLHVSVEAVRELIREEHLSAINVSRSSIPRYRIAQETVDEFVEASGVGA